MNIEFFMPTKVIMTEECVSKNLNLLTEFGQKALIVTGANSARNNGSLQDITKALTALNIELYIYDKVMANPTVSCVYDGAALAREKQVDFIIGIGGGSPMDAAKAIALLAVQDIPEDQLFQAKLENKALPTVMIPTTAGTGSEVTRNAVLTSDALQTKKSIATFALFPKLALLDAKYMLNLPMSITINTSLDALSHAVEGMLSKRSTQLIDCIALESIRKITDCLGELSPESSQNLSPVIREKLLYGSMLAGIVISHTGTTAVHSMGYSLTYFKNIAHGRANALLLPSFLRFVAKGNPESVKKILEAMELNSLNEFEALFLRLLGERESITLKEAQRFTAISSQARNIVNSKVIPTKEDIYNIYTRSLSITEF